MPIRIQNFNKPPMAADFIFDRTMGANKLINIPKTIVLVGLMGAGKTCIGRRLAKRLNLPFIDADDEIEKSFKAALDKFKKTQSW